MTAAKERSEVKSRITLMFSKNNRIFLKRRVKRIGIFVKPKIALNVSIIIFTLGEIYNTLGSQPYLTRRIPVTHRGRISSVRNIFTSLSVAIVQNGVGFLIDHHSMIFMWIVITIVGCLTVGMVMILRIIDKKDYPRLYEKTYSK